jgi:hypothetical protein
MSWRQLLQCIVEPILQLLIKETLTRPKVTPPSHPRVMHSSCEAGAMAGKEEKRKLSASAAMAEWRSF